MNVWMFSCDALVNLNTHAHARTHAYCPRPSPTVQLLPSHCHTRPSFMMAITQSSLLHGLKKDMPGHPRTDPFTAQLESFHDVSRSQFFYEQPQPRNTRFYTFCLSLSVLCCGNLIAHAGLSCSQSRLCALLSCFCVCETSVPFSVVAHFPQDLV